tara:strand:+ start:104 stop:526 length:423 start_codon:yes stop_codon:yes gene_type:complete
VTDKQASIEAAKKVYSDWAAGFATADLDKIVALYAPDAVLESPLVNVLLKTDDGIVTGRDNLRNFFGIILSDGPPLDDRHRESFFTDGKTMIWEYPRITPKGKQLEMTEVMHLENGLIKVHRIYWGWESARKIFTEGYHG